MLEDCASTLFLPCTTLVAFLDGIEAVHIISVHILISWQRPTIHELYTSI